MKMVIVLYLQANIVAMVHVKAVKMRLHARQIVAIIIIQNDHGKKILALTVQIIKYSDVLIPVLIIIIPWLKRMMEHVKRVVMIRKMETKRG